jgi:hypothetical protein
MLCFHCIRQAQAHALCSAEEACLCWGWSYAPCKREVRSFGRATTVTLAGTVAEEDECEEEVEEKGDAEVLAEVAVVWFASEPLTAALLSVVFDVHVAALRDVVALFDVPEVLEVRGLADVCVGSG